MDEVEIEVQALLNNLVDRVAAMTSERSAETRVEVEVERVDMEFFSEIFDIMPTQFCASQHPPPSPMKDFFKVPSASQRLPPPSPREDLFKMPSKQNPRTDYVQAVSRTFTRAPPMDYADFDYQTVESNAVPISQTKKPPLSVIQEFCPPYSVGAYATAPLSLHASRKIRVGLSRSRRPRYYSPMDKIYEE